MDGSDALAEVLRTLDLSAQRVFRTERESPFSMAMPERVGEVCFHAVAEGECTIALGDGTRCACGPGDLVLMPYGSAHVVADERPAGAHTLLVCGHLAFDASLASGAAVPLPWLLHLPAGPETSYAWIEPLVRHVERGTRAGRAASAEVVRRLAEILCIELLCACAGASADEGAPLPASLDLHLGRALRALHDDLEAAWTLERLARIAGLSRTLFAERFRERVGVSPMHYLAACRMRKARSLLTRADIPVSEVARRVGYTSESAFTRRFRARYGTPPGAWRRARRGDWRGIAAPDPSGCEGGSARVRPSRPSEERVIRPIGQESRTRERVVARLPASVVGGTALPSVGHPLPAPDASSRGDHPCIASIPFPASDE